MREKPVRNKDHDGKRTKLHDGSGTVPVSKDGEGAKEGIVCDDLNGVGSAGVRETYCNALFDGEGYGGLGHGVYEAEHVFGAYEDYKDWK